MKPSRKDEAKRREQELAWIGDTILDLYAREWILRERGTVCGETQRRMTCNSSPAMAIPPRSKQRSANFIKIRAWRPRLPGFRPKFFPFLRNKNEIGDNSKKIPVLLISSRDLSF